eukprot:TRINITY_DN8909_c0_g2_i3.p1 TRINITY_DN8909_c0_g2~~TRINITY_DN8909_c0_g2_i3.p1  ORF type:complete len:529 (+),score=71.27 TRINITY_DN8909_c0_g2_i3:233-1588(+)
MANDSADSWDDVFDDEPVDTASPLPSPKQPGKAITAFAGSDQDQSDWDSTAPASPAKSPDMPSPIQQQEPELKPEPTVNQLPSRPTPTVNVESIRSTPVAASLASENAASAMSSAHSSTNNAALVAQQSKKPLDDDSDDAADDASPKPRSRVKPKKTRGGKSTSRSGFGMFKRSRQHPDRTSDIPSINETPPLTSSAQISSQPTSLNGPIKPPAINQSSSHSAPSIANHREAPPAKPSESMQDQKQASVQGDRSSTISSQRASSNPLQYNQHDHFAGASFKSTGQPMCGTYLDDRHTEIFTFQHDPELYSSRPFDTEDATTRCAQSAEADSRAVFHAGFTSLRAMVNIVLALLFELLSLMLHIARKLTVEVVALVSNLLLKPLLHALYNGILHPVFVLLRHITTGLANAIEPLAHALAPFVAHVAQLLRSFRLIEWKTAQAERDRQQLEHV